MEWICEQKPAAPLQNATGGVHRTPRGVASLKIFTRNKELEVVIKFCGTNYENVTAGIFSALEARLLKQLPFGMRGHLK